MGAQLKMSLYVDANSTVPWLSPPCLHLVPRADCFLVTGGDGGSVCLSSSLLVSLSPLVRDLQKPFHCLTGHLLLPSVRERELEVTRQILTSGCSHKIVEEELVWKVLDVLSLLQIKIKLVRGLLGKHGELVSFSPVDIEEKGDSGLKVEAGSGEYMENASLKGEVKEEIILKDELSNSVENQNEDSFHGCYSDSFVPDLVSEDMDLGSPIINIKPVTPVSKNDAMTNSTALPTVPLPTQLERPTHQPGPPESEVTTTTDKETTTNKTNTMETKTCEERKCETDIFNSKNLTGNIYKCKLCDKSYKRKQGLKVHIAAKHVQNSNMDNKSENRDVFDCEKSFKNKHVQNSNRDNKSENRNVFDCETCEQSDKNKQAFESNISNKPIIVEHNLVAGETEHYSKVKSSCPDSNNGSGGLGGSTTSPASGITRKIQIVNGKIQVPGLLRGQQLGRIPDGKQQIFSNKSASGAGSPVRAAGIKELGETGMISKSPESTEGTSLSISLDKLHPQPVALAKGSPGQLNGKKYAIMSKSNVIGQIKSSVTPRLPATQPLPSVPHSPTNQESNNGGQPTQTEPTSPPAVQTDSLGQPASGKQNMSVGIQSLGAYTVTISNGQLVVQGPDRIRATEIAKQLSSGQAKLATLGGKQVLLTFSPAVQGPGAPALR